MLISFQSINNLNSNDRLSTNQAHKDIFKGSAAKLIKLNSDCFVSFGKKGGSVGRPLYAISAECEVRRFDTTQKACKELKVPAHALYACISGLKKTSRGYVFARGHQIMDETGNIDYKKVKKLAEKFKAICAIDGNNNVKTYHCLDKASEDTGLSKSIISECLDGNRRSINGLVFVRRKKIEDEEGKIKLNETKSIWKSHTTSRKLVSFYVVDNDYNYKFYRGASDVAKSLGVCRSAVAGCRNGEFKTVKGYAIIPEDKVLNKAGEFDFDMLKAEADNRFYDRQIFRSVGKNKLVGIRKNGEMKIFDSVKSACKFIGTTSVSASLQNYVKTAKGWAFINLLDLLDENEEIDPKKVNEFIAKRFSRAKRTLRKLF